MSESETASGIARTQEHNKARRSEKENRNGKKRTLYKRQRRQKESAQTIKPS